MPYKDTQKAKEMHKKASRKYYEANKELTTKRTKENRKRYKKIWQTFKNHISCAHCGMSHPACMDFHHTDPTNKLGEVNRFVKNKAWKKAYEEAAKCTVLCANCHRIHHYELREEKKKGAEAPVDHSKSTSCSSSYPSSASSNSTISSVSNQSSASSS